MLSRLKKEGRIILSTLLNKSKESLVYWYILTVGCLFLFVVPPFQKTDEVVHFYKTIALARGQFGCPNELPAYLATLPNNLHTNLINTNEAIRIPRGEYKKVLLTTDYSTGPVSITSACPLPALFYLPVGMVLSIPVLLELHPFFIFYLGRAVFFVLGLALIYVALRIIPRQYRGILIAVASFPMLLMQLSSYNKEVFHIGFGLMSFAAIMALRERTKPQSLLKLVLLGIPLSLFILPRPQYVLFFLLPLFVRWNWEPLKKATQHPVKRGIALSSVTITAVLLAIGMYGKSVQWFHRYTHDYRGVYPNLQLQYILSEPLNICRVVLQTVAESGLDLYFSMIGAFGWTHSHYSWVVYAIYTAGLATFVVHVKKQFHHTTLKELLLLACIMGGTASFVVLAMYVYSTPVAYPSIQDIQGRYFLMIVPFGIWFVAAVLSKLKKTTSLFALGALLIWLLGQSLYTRYYDYTKYYYSAGQFSTFTPSPQNEVVQLTTEYQQPIRVEQQKKLVGFALFLPNKYSTFTTKPWRMELRDSSCKTVLRDAMIVPSRLREGEFNDLLFKNGLHTEGRDTLCLAIVPYDTMVMNETYPVLVNSLSEKKIILRLLYQY